MKQWVSLYVALLCPVPHEVICFPISLLLLECHTSRVGVRHTLFSVVLIGAPGAPEQIIDVIKVIPEEWMSKRIVQQIVDVPVPQILEEIVALVAGEVVCNARTGVRRQHGWTCTK